MRTTRILTKLPTSLIWREKMMTEHLKQRFEPQKYCMYGQDRTSWWRVDDKGWRYTDDEKEAILATLLSSGDKMGWVGTLDKYLDKVEREAEAERLEAEYVRWNAFCGNSRKRVLKKWLKYCSGLTGEERSTYLAKLRI